MVGAVGYVGLVDGVYLVAGAGWYGSEVDCERAKDWGLYVE